MVTGRRLAQQGMVEAGVEEKLATQPADSQTRFLLGPNCFLSELEKSIQKLQAPEVEKIFFAAGKINFAISAVSG